MAATAPCSSYEPKQVLLEVDRSCLCIHRSTPRHTAIFRPGSRCCATVGGHRPRETPRARYCRPRTIGPPGSSVRQVYYFQATRARHTVDKTRFVVYYDLTTRVPTSPTAVLLYFFYWHVHLHVVLSLGGFFFTGGKCIFLGRGRPVRSAPKGGGLYMCFSCTIRLLLDKTHLRTKSVFRQYSRRLSPSDTVHQ